MKRTFPILGALLAMLALCLAPLTGCKGKLETGGAYAPGVATVSNGVTNSVSTSAPEMDLFIADNAFNIAVDSLQIVFKTERDNRALLLAKAPQVKKSLDSIRPQVVDAMKAYGLARKAYLSNPTPAGLDAVNEALAKAQQLVGVAQAAIPPDALTAK